MLHTHGYFVCVYQLFIYETRFWCTQFNGDALMGMCFAYQNQHDCLFTCLATSDGNIVNELFSATPANPCEISPNDEILYRIASSLVWLTRIYTCRLVDIYETHQGETR